MAGLIVTTVTLQIPSDTRYVAMARKSVRLVAETSGFSTVECQDIEIAVAEAVTNAIIHATPQHSQAPVIVRCEALPGTIAIEVEDEGGSHYIPAEQKLPPVLQENGRGTIIMKTIMDEFMTACTHKGLRVKMIKNSASIICDNTDDSERMALEELLLPI